MTIFEHKQVSVGMRIHGASFLDTAGGIEYDTKSWRFWQKSVNWLRRKRGLPIKYGRWVSFSEMQERINNSLRESFNFIVLNTTDAATSEIKKKDEADPANDPHWWI